MLLFVLGIVLLLGIVGIALLQLTTVSGRTATSSSISSRALRDVDGAFEVAIHDFRGDETLEGGAPASCDGLAAPDYPMDGTTDHIVVSCTDGEPFTADYRIMDLAARRVGASGPGTLVGKARVKVVDRVNTTPVFGYSIEVCDWLLGNSAGGAELRGCST